MEDVLDLAELARALVVGDPEQRCLGLLHQLARVAGDAEDLVLDLARRTEQAAQQRVVLDDPAVVADVARSRDHARQRVHVSRAARLLELAGPLQLLAHGQRVDGLGLGLLAQPDHRPEDQPVALAVEVLGREPDVD